MKSNRNLALVPGWVGGFVDTNPDFAYPNPNLSSLEVLDNLENIHLLTRQQAVKWPEFSWETIPGKPESRCYQMFAPYISRLGYTDKGRVYSIICPQQGAGSPLLGSMNVEITVTGQRGWVNEETVELAADMGVEAKIWFAPGANSIPFVQRLWDKFRAKELPFPSSKANAIRISTHKVGDKKEPLFALRGGETDRFEIPEFARHEEEAWAVGNLSVEIGEIQSSGSRKVNVFNKIIVGIFNKASGNMLKKGNVLTWNVWFTPPELVDQDEWREHAIKWRDSIQANHGSPEPGSGRESRYFDGTPFKSGKKRKSRGTGKVTIQTPEEIAEEEREELEAYLDKHF